jgi:transposase
MTSGWVIEDVRHVSGGLERFLIDRGETVVRLPPRLMSNARQDVRERGKSDPIDALAIARAALREGVDTLPTARLAGVELEIRLLGLHRERLVDTRTRFINELRWQLHDLWPDWEIPKRVLIQQAWQTKIGQRLRRAPSTVQVQIARDMITHVRELTRTITQLYHQLATLVAQVAPQLLAEKGLGVLIAAKLIGEIAGIDRFTSEAQLARISGCAPIPVSSGRTDRHRLDPGGNRQLNHAFHMLALTKILHDPERWTTSPSSAATARATGKRFAASNATSSDASITSSATPANSQRPSPVDIGAIGERRVPTDGARGQRPLRSRDKGSSGGAPDCLLKRLGAARQLTLEMHAGTGRTSKRVNPACRLHSGKRRS